MVGDLLCIWRVGHLSEQLEAAPSCPSCGLHVPDGFAPRAVVLRLGRAWEEPHGPRALLGHLAPLLPTAAAAVPQDDRGPPAPAPPSPPFPVHRCTPSQVCANVLPSFEKNSGGR